MTKKRYIPDNGAIEANPTRPLELSAKQQDTSYSVQDLYEELYNRVGERFRIEWDPWGVRYPIIFTDTLPSGVSQADVENALNSMRDDGIL